ncbi:uncharacterized protein IL334_003226 [Kwoniella shivajii]|uniref:Uncharacterized protein n=1 Tax=Kwoniella shivajii TaxID=564305 RepID=A0ABZ1CWZ5_9TREE|nr:hypothetical protein IL334_003226 [Kwoniella shivajii]
MNSVKSLGSTHLLADLEDLSVEISNLSHHLSHKTPSSPAAPKSSTASRLSKLISHVLPSRSVSLRKRGTGKYKDVDARPLIFRRGSDDSDQTLVDPSNNELSAEELLNLLAPSMTRLQRLSRKVAASNNGFSSTDYSVKSTFNDICTQFLDLLQSLRCPSSSDPDTDPDYKGNDDPRDDSEELEMRNLMLSALTKKLQIENNRCSSLSPSLIDARNPFIIHSSSLSSESKIRSISSLESRPSTVKGMKFAGNDFVDTEILLSPSIHPKRFSKPIKIDHKNIDIDKDKVGGTEDEINTVGSFSSFLSKYQNSTNSRHIDNMNNPWAQNVIRLGSFQASLLFSNSPIAVRKLSGNNPNPFL